MRAAFALSVSACGKVLPCCIGISNNASFTLCAGLTGAMMGDVYLRL